MTSTGGIVTEPKDPPKLRRRVIYIDDESWKQVKALARHRLTTASDIIRGLVDASLGK